MCRNYLLPTATSSSRISRLTLSGMTLNLAKVAQQVPSREHVRHLGKPFVLNVRELPKQRVRAFRADTRVAGRAPPGRRPDRDQGAPRNYSTISASMLALMRTGQAVRLRTSSISGRVRDWHSRRIPDAIGWKNQI
jgi:hypothetical protein